MSASPASQAVRATAGASGLPPSRSSAASHAPSRTSRVAARRATASASPSHGLHPEALRGERRRGPDADADRDPPRGKQRADQSLFVHSIVSFCSMARNIRCDLGARRESKRLAGPDRRGGARSRSASTMAVVGGVLFGRAVTSSPAEAPPAGARSAAGRDERAAAEARRSAEPEPRRGRPKEPSTRRERIARVANRRRLVRGDRTRRQDGRIRAGPPVLSRRASSKSMLLVAELRRLRREEAPLDDSTRSLLEQMITRLRQRRRRRDLRAGGRPRAERGRRGQPA